MNIFKRNNNRKEEASHPVSEAIPFDVTPMDTGVHFTPTSRVSRDLSIGITPSPQSTRVSTPVSRHEPVSRNEPVSRHEPADPNEGKTRLVGFDTSDGRLELFGEDQKSDVGGVSFKPVGFLMVVDGPGEGHCFSLNSGMSTIGRSSDQTVSLDYGDRAISRSNHAAVVYDAQTHQFLLGHGGKANIVRLNGVPVVMTEAIESGALIQIGATTMRFVALCDAEFNWNDDESESDDDLFL